MACQVDKFTTLRHELEEVALAAVKLSEATSGRSVSEWSHEYASYIFSKICAHALSALSLAPTGLTPTKPGSTEIWDLASLCAIVRALIDSYYAMYYIAIDQVSAEERSFRQALWEFQGEHKRLELLQLKKSKSPELLKLRDKVDRMRATVIQDSFFARLSPEIQKKARKGDLPLHLSNSELSTRAGIQPDYYKAVYRFLSSYIHTYPFSVSQLAQFRAGSSESLGLISVTLQYCLAFLCVAVRDFRTLFPDMAGFIGKDVDNTIEVWLYVVANPAR